MTGQPVSGREQATRWSKVARERWQAGEIAEAAAFNHACKQVDPDRGGLWQARAEQLAEAANRLPLAEQTTVRLIIAGYHPESRAIVAVREHNAQLMEKEMGQ